MLIKKSYASINKKYIQINRGNIARAKTLSNIKVKNKISLLISFNLKENDRNLIKTTFIA